MPERPRRRYRDKLDWIRPEIAGRSVLYIGAVDEEPSSLAKHASTQAELAPYARAMLGLYRSEAQAREVVETGYEAVSAEVESFELGSTFDRIVAADNIEHLSDCGGFLRSLERHLAPGGRMLISTPNPTSLVRILVLLLRGSTKAHTQHTGWFTAQVMGQLAARYGLELTSVVCVDEMHRYHRPDLAGRKMGPGRRILSRLLVATNGIACRALPQLSETYGFVLERRGAAGRSTVPAA